MVSGSGISHEHVCGFGVKVLKIPKVVVGSLSLRNLIMWFRLDGMN